MTNVRTLAEGLLRCSGCGEMLPPESFALNLQRPRGRQSTCKSCRRQRYYATPPDVRRERNRRVLSPEQKARKAEYKRQKLYGLDQAGFTSLLKSQEYRCAICKAVPQGAFYVDHNHETGAVRGLLCNRCNVSLGFHETWYLPLKDVVDSYA